MIDGGEAPGRPTCAAKACLGCPNNKWIGGTLDRVLLMQPVVCCKGCKARKLEPSALVVAVAIAATVQGARCIQTAQVPFSFELAERGADGESLARRRVLRAGQFQSESMAFTPKIATMEQSMARLAEYVPEWLCNTLPWTLAATLGQIGTKMRSGQRHELARIDGPARTPPGRTGIEWSTSGAA